MGHDQRGVRQEFNNEVAVADSIETILIYTIKTKLLRHKMTVNRERRSGKCSGAQRQHVNPLIAVRQTLRIAAEHGHVSQQVMGE
ncbi:hypothetical protein D3C86_1909770 [compost metagenome]